MNSTYIGRLGDDPSLRYADNGTAWMGVGFAIDVRAKVDGEWKSTPIWADLKAFGSIAEHVAAHASKGTRLIVIGELQPTQYTNKQGEVVKTLQLVAQDVGLDVRFGLDGSASAPTSESSPYGASTERF